MLELYRKPITGFGNPYRLNGPLINSGSLLDFKISPDSRWVVYRALQDRPDVFEIYSRAPSQQPATGKGKSAVPLTTSPAGLLREGAAKKIQQRLARAGAPAEMKASGELDGPTRAALARYQRAHDLPATGDPDDATVQRLGLDPDEVFVSRR